MSTIRAEADTATIYTPGGRFEIRIIDSGEIEIRTPDGSLNVSPQHDNSVRIQCVPTWSDKTAALIVGGIINGMGDEPPDAAAEMIVNFLRGRINNNLSQKHLDEGMR